jgi:hypothetical protein
MSKPERVSFTGDEIACPRCEKVVADSWEYEDGDLHTCEQCKATFQISLDHSVTYTTVIFPPEDSR